MVYLKCEVCGQVYCAPESVKDLLCGSFVGFSLRDNPVKCGGRLYKITQEDAENITEELRNEKNCY